MFDVELGIDTALLEALRDAHQTVPEAVDRFAKRELRPFASQFVDRTLRREPGPVKYPIQWTSPKQRRYYFAVLAVYDPITHAIVPYQRTGRYIRGWHVRGDYANGLTSIRVYNEESRAQFIGGRRQQRFHRNTGWPNAADVLQALSLDLNERIEVGLPLVIDQALGGQ